jgi:hypothetical protein
MHIDNYNSQRGTPVVMWPDDKKDASSYEATAVINNLWEEFQEALSRTKQVALLGHSLHDPFLVAALRAVPQDRVVVAIYDDEDRAKRKTEESRVTDLLGAVAVVPIRFGAGVEGLPALEAARRHPMIRDAPERIHLSE